MSVTPTAPAKLRVPEAELGRQRWRRVLPIVFVTYSLAYLDRTNYSIAIAWAFVFRALVSDHPREAAWLDPAEKDAVERTLEEEQRSLPRTRGYREALRSHNVVLLSLQYFLWSVGVYGFVFWLPSIVKAGSGAGIGDTGLISAAPYALAAILMYLNSRASDRSGTRVVFVWPWLALGAFAGSYFVGWLDDLTGGTSASFLLLAGSLAAGAVLMLFVRAPDALRVASARFQR